MKQVVLLILSLFMIQWNFGQLNTKTKTNEDGSKIITCYHKNGKASTIETWDEKHREGNMTGFSNEGKEIFNYGLRSYAGHASVYLNYYTNGQVKKAEYSSAPDGGIQFWRIIHQFDEAGNQTSYQDLSQPDGHPVIPTFVSDTTGQYERKKTELKKPEIVECATPYITEFVLVNETKKTVTITMKAKYNQYVQLKDTILTLKPKQSIVFNSTMMAQLFLPETCFEPQTATGKLKKEKNKFIFAQPTEAKNTKTYRWHVLAK